MTTLYLAVDAATDIASVALGAPGTVPAERLLDPGPRRHAAELLPAVTVLLRAAGIRPDELAGVVVGDGPGSFTGVRVAAALAKGLTHGTEVGFFAVPSLLGCAWHAAHSVRQTGPVAAVYDALRGEVFAAVYEGVRVVASPTVVAAEELHRLGPARLAAGEGAVRYSEAAAAWTGRAPVGPPAGRASAAALLEAVWADLERFRVAEPDRWEPVYGRRAEAQVRWEARHGRPLPHPSGPRG